MELPSTEFLLGQTPIIINSATDERDEKEKTCWFPSHYAIQGNINSYYPEPSTILGMIISLQTPPDLPLVF
jgi:hypothetical protein